MNNEIKRLIGETLMLAFDGTEYNEELDSLIHEYYIRNFILFGKNVESCEQVARLNGRLIQEADSPLFIAVDQEGGIVRRVRSGVFPLPGAMAMAAGDPDSIRDACYLTGKGLKALGFNCDFAPDADVNSNPKNPVICARSYGDNPQKVAEYATEAALGFQESGMLPTLKHFPGHGDTAVDSHVGLPSIGKTKEEMAACELVPFKYGADHGVDGIMCGHLQVNCYDDTYPSSLSRAILTDLLRKELGYKGLLVTDSLTMSAIWGHYTTKEIVKLSLLAGNDIILFCGDSCPKQHREIINAAYELYEEGVITKELLEDRANRVKAMKAKYPCVTPDLSMLFNEAEQQEGRYLQEQSITLVRDDAHLIPVKDTKKMLIISEPTGTATIGEGEKIKYTTVGSVSGLDEVIIEPGVGLIEELKKHILAIESNYDTIVLANYRAKDSSGLIEIYKELDKNKVALLLLRSPFEATFYPGVKTVIAAYDGTIESLKAVAHVLSYRLPLNGKLPVDSKNI